MNPVLAGGDALRTADRLDHELARNSENGKIVLVLDEVEARRRSIGEAILDADSRPLLWLLKTVTRRKLLIINVA